MQTFFNSLKASFSTDLDKKEQQQHTGPPSQTQLEMTQPTGGGGHSELEGGGGKEEVFDLPAVKNTAQGLQESEKTAATNHPAQFKDKFLGMALKASSKLQEKAVKITTNLDPKTIIGNMEKERQKFIGELNREKGLEKAGALDQLLSNPLAQKHIISITSDAKNFTEEPPLTFDLESDIEEIKACAAELFRLDPRLKDVRFALVPKQVSEEKFWRNYAYKLSLVKKVLDEKQSQEPSGQEQVEKQKVEDTSGSGRKESTEEDEQDDSLEKELLLCDLDEYEVVNGGGGSRKEEEQKLNEELNEEIDALLEGKDGE